MTAPAHPLRRRRSSGFTLLELMAAVVVVGLLATLAVPSYRSYVLRANRAVVRTLLVDLAAKLEVEALRRGGYPDTFDFYLIGADRGFGAEREFFITARGQVIGDVGDAGYDDSVYGIRLLAAEADALGQRRDYTLTARALHGQLGDRNCLTLSLQANGRRSATPGSVEECWGR